MNFELRSSCRNNNKIIYSFSIYFCHLYDLRTRLGTVLSDDDSESVSREASPCSESPRPVSLGSESPLDNSIHASVMASASMSTCSSAMAMRHHAKVSVVFSFF